MNWGVICRGEIGDGSQKVLPCVVTCCCTANNNVAGGASMQDQEICSDDFLGIFIAFLNYTGFLHVHVPFVVSKKC